MGIIAQEEANNEKSKQSAKLEASKMAAQMRRR